MTEQERAEGHVPSLPSTLYEAIQCLQKDRLIRDTLGEHCYTRYVEAKLIEWNEYKVQVTPWELKKYLTRF
jgi:L-glutamine synthetase (EC 6.3.1.2)